MIIVLDRVAKALEQFLKGSSASPDQIIAFLGELLCPKLPVKPLRALAFR
jgi:hypothetical protein